LICSGSELEIGWIPLLLTQSGNPGSSRQSGYFEASQYVVKLKYRKSSTGAGDLHPGGNPHIHTDPRNIARVALALEERMVQIDPANADSYARAVNRSSNAGRRRSRAGSARRRRSRRTDRRVP